MVADAELGDVEDAPLGGVEQFLGRLILIERILLHFGASVNEMANDRFLPDDLGIMLDVTDGRGGLPELGQVLVAAHVGDQALFVQIIGQRHRVGRLALMDADIG